MILYQISPLCMGFSDIKYSYTNETTGKETNLPPDVQKPPMLAKIKIPLPPGSTLHSSQEVNITFLREKITPDEDFDGYFYMLDPNNFSKTVHKLTLEIRVYNKEYHRTPIRFYSIDGVDGSHKEVEIGRHQLIWDSDLGYCKCTTDSLKIKENAFYVFRIKK